MDLVGVHPFRPQLEVAAWDVAEVLGTRIAIQLAAGASLRSRLRRGMSPVKQFRRARTTPIVWNQTVASFRPARSSHLAHDADAETLLFSAGSPELEPCTLLAAYGREDLYLLQVAAELDNALPWHNRQPPAVAGER